MASLGGSDLHHAISTRPRLQTWDSEMSAEVLHIRLLLCHRTQLPCRGMGLRACLLRELALPQ